MNYTLKRSDRARTMRLAVHPDGAVVVTAPRYFELAAIERFVLKYSEWIRKHLERTKGKTVIRLKRADIPRLKRKTREFVTKRVEHFARVYGVSYKKIAIRSQKSRWGSCSKSGNLSFNYKIAALPPEIADCIVVHELCHRIEFNHSKKFWALVARTFPDHLRIRKELKNTVILFS